ASIHTLSLHAALPIWAWSRRVQARYLEPGCGLHRPLITGEPAMRIAPTLLLAVSLVLAGCASTGGQPDPNDPTANLGNAEVIERSEEHTSELQSREKL